MGNTVSVVNEACTKNSNLALSNGSLLKRYMPSSDAYFSSPNYALLAKPPFANLLAGAGPTDLVQRVMESLRFANELGHVNAIIVGAVPFDSDKPPYLRLSTDAELIEKSADKNIQRGSTYTPEHCEFDIQSHPEAETFKASVKKALSLLDNKEFDNDQLQKVVLSRTLNIFSPSPFNINAILEHLEKENRDGYIFSVELVNENSAAEVRQGVLVGASPELLISVRDGKVFANPLAGSEPRDGNEKEDNARSKQLLSSAKDRHEHELVVKAVKQALEPYCRELDIPATPSVIKTPTMLHLSTSITGTLIDSSTPSIALALALHPTPAVCGTPTAQAREAIAQLETHDRDAFCGIVGWCDAQGNGDWVVTIRCAKIHENEATLYAGAGIVAGSCPDKEWRETGAKFKTMLNAIGA